MTNCAKCGAELIGSRKFCTACGAPAVDPATLKRDSSVSGSGSAPGSSPSAPGSGGYGGASSPAPNVALPSNTYGPPSEVNPFASTASPSHGSSKYGPPPAISIHSQPGASSADPPQQSQVSPLAVSNALSERGAFQKAANEALGGAPSTPARVPGTVMMPSMANPAAAIAGAASKRPDRTQMMNASAFQRPSSPSGSMPAAHAPAPVPSQPQAAAPAAPAAPPQPHQAAAPQGAWSGWGAAPQPQGYGFGGYVPGARVNVMWSNGQRYPAVVHQVSGNRCLVVFPDGQQHWVEMQYLSPG